MEIALLIGAVVVAVVLLANSPLARSTAKPRTPIRTPSRSERTRTSSSRSRQTRAACSKPPNPTARDSTAHVGAQSPTVEHAPGRRALRELRHAGGRVAVLTEMSGDRPSVMASRRTEVRRPPCDQETWIRASTRSLAAADGDRGCITGRRGVWASSCSGWSRCSWRRLRRRRRRVRERPGGAGAMRPRIPARTDPREQHVRRGVRRLAPRRRPRRRATASPWRSARCRLAVEGDGGDRGPALLDARRRVRLHGHRPRRGRRRPGRAGSSRAARRSPQQLVARPRSAPASG